MTEYSFRYEDSLYRKGCSIVAGVDEAGRGPLAGPVIAGAVVLPQSCDYHRFKDSKKLGVKARERIYACILEMNCPFGIGRADPDEIADLNILRASLLAMQRAVVGLTIRPDYLLVDGKFPVPVDLPQSLLVRGEGESASIAAASIIAKVSRDQIMTELHEQFPCYNFHKNKGYPTREHRMLIRQHGPSAVHRASFKGVREYL
ncbi:MAG: ribonuclease HII [Desulfurivibrionaceae bacterium]